VTVRRFVRIGASGELSASIRRRFLFADVKKTAPVRRLQERPTEPPAESGAVPMFPKAVRPRIASLDLLRGIIMVLMALDHTRDFFTNVPFNPLNLGQTSIPLFLTRWITHFCAPLFVFLSGASAFLYLARGKTTGDLSRFLITRGLWLIVLEITVIHWFGWSFSLDLRSVGGGVIWAIGWSMLVLGGLVHLPPSIIGAFGVVLIAGHNLLDSVRPEQFGSFGWLWKILHAGGGFEYAPGYRFGAYYPLIPWIGVMALGFVFGPILRQESARRRQWMMRGGMLGVLAFVLLRAGNLYGDPGRWSVQKNDVFTLFSFVHCQKYPPSLLYLLMTLGPGLMLLAWLDRKTPRWLEPLKSFGQVPLFFYLLHLPLIHGLAVLVNHGRYGRADWLFGWPFVEAPVKAPDDQGFGLLIVYLATAFVVFLLYPVCRWFAELKQRRPDAWLSYL
jgi:uncharacterized membrane protein